MKGYPFIFWLPLFFLPWFEGDLKIWGYILLFLISGLIGLLGSKKIKFDRFDYLFLAILIFASLSTIFSTGASRSFLELLRYLSYFIIFITIRRLNSEISSKLKAAYILAILLNTFLLSIVSFSFLLQNPILPPPSTGMNLYFAVFGHNNLVSLLLFAIPITFLLMVKYSQDGVSLSHNYLKFLFIFYSFAFAFTFSKGGYLVIIFVFLLILNVLKKKFANRWGKSNILLLLIIPTALLFIFIVLNTYFLKFHERPSYSVINKPLYLDWRWDYYKAAFEGLKQSPVLGVGLDNFRYLSKLHQARPSSWSWYGENYYLTVLSEAGILGGLSMLILLVLIFRKLYINVSEGNNLVDCGIFFALAASALHVLFSDDWYFLSIFLYFWVGAALLLPSEKKYPEIHHQNGHKLQFISIFLTLIALFYSIGTLSYQLARKYNSNFLFQTASLFNFYDIQTQLDIGAYYKDKQDFNSAIYYYGKAQRLEPKDYASYLAEGDLLEIQGDMQGAVRNYISAFNLDPLDLSGYRLKIYKIYIQKVGSFLKEQKYNQAIDLVYAIKDAFPDYFQKTDKDNYFRESKSGINMKDKKEVIRKMENFVKRGLQTGKI